MKNQIEVSNQSNTFQASITTSSKWTKWTKWTDGLNFRNHWFQHSNSTRMRDSSQITMALFWLLISNWTDDLE